MIRSEVVISKVWRSEVENLALFFVLCLMSVILSHKFPFLIIKGRLLDIGSMQVNFVLPLLWLIPFFLLSYTVYRVYNVHYTLDYRGVQACIGRLSLKQSINRIRYEDIRAIDIYQTLIERMMDIGTVEIGTAASANTEVALEGISAPEELKNMLEKERDGRLKPGMNQPGATHIRSE